METKKANSNLYLMPVKVINEQCIFCPDLQIEVSQVTGYGNDGYLNIHNALECVNYSRCKHIQKSIINNVRSRTGSMGDLIGWYRDDITWCSDSENCDRFDCKRHLKNRSPEYNHIMFSAAMLKGTDICPIVLDMAKEYEEGDKQ